MPRPPAAPVYAVIPAGGAGSRLWPRSRRVSPKHVLPLSGSGLPLVREAYERIAPLVDRVFVVTEHRQAHLVRGLVPGLSAEQLIVEPAARGTTSALGLAAMSLAERDPRAVMISVAADHVIRNQRAYRAAVRRALAVAAASEELVAIGLRPAWPATGFGYIETGPEVRIGRWAALRVRRFVEKPAAAAARRYLKGGRHYWNLSMFAFRCTVFLEELARFAPRHHAGLRRVLAARRAGDEAAAGRRYARLPAAAVDYTVMEPTDRMLMVPASFGWADVGSWSELAGLRPAGAGGNVLEGSHILIDAEGCFVSAPDRLVALVGLRDLVVVDTPDALLICPKARAQDVKRVVEALGRLRKTDYL